MKMQVNNIQLNVEQSGNGEMAMIFLHFWGGSVNSWREVTGLLESQYRCISIDARGAGDSGISENSYSIRDHAADVLALIQQLGLTRYIIVGHSMGGKTAQLAAASHPEGLAGIVLVASSPLSAMQITEQQRRQMYSAYSSPEAATYTVDNILSSGGLNDKIKQRTIEDALRMSHSAVAGWLECGSREDFSTLSPEINVPVMIMAGDQDKVDPLPVVRQVIAPMFPAAPVHIIEGKGHLLPLEAASDVAALIKDFAIKLTGGKIQ